MILYAGVLENSEGALSHMLTASLISIQQQLLCKEGSDRLQEMKRR